MRVVVTLEQRFDCTPDGFIWGPATFAYSFWQRYLEVFDEVLVVARVKAVKSPPENTRRASGDKVSFVQVPYYIGPGQFIRCARYIIPTLN